MGEAFGLNQPFPVYLLAAAANLIISTPSTYGGVGPFEWATKAVLLVFLSSANAEELATAYAAALHGLVLIPIALLGLVFLWLYKSPYAAPSKARAASRWRARLRPSRNPTETRGASD